MKRRPKIKADNVIPQEGSIDKVCFDYPIKYRTPTVSELQERIGKIDNRKRILELGRDEITRLTAYLDLPDNVEEEANRIYRISISSNLSYNYSVAEMASGAIYTTCKKQETLRALSEIYGGSVLSNKMYLPPRLRLAQPRTQQVSSFGNIRYAPATTTGSEIKSTYKKVIQLDEIEEPYNLYNLEDFLERYTRVLGLDMSYIDTARVWMNKYGSEMENSSPRLQAAVSLCQISDIFENDIDYTDICIVSGYHIHSVSAWNSEF